MSERTKIEIDREHLELIEWALVDGCFCDDNPYCICCKAREKARLALGLPVEDWVKDAP